MEDVVWEFSLENKRINFHGFISEYWIVWICSVELYQFYLLVMCKWDMCNMMDISNVILVVL